MKVGFSFSDRCLKGIIQLRDVKVLGSFSPRCYTTGNGVAVIDAEPVSFDYSSRDARQRNSSRAVESQFE